MTFLGTSKYSPGGAAGGTTESFSETLASATSGTITNTSSEELDVDINAAAYHVDAILVYSSTTGTDIDVKFTMEVYQLNAGDLTAADTAHDIQSALRLIYKEDDIILHNTQINGTEAAAQSTLTVDDSDKLAKYDLVFLSDGADTDNWYRISSVASATSIVIFDDLVAEKADNSQVFHVYERRNLGFVFNKSTDDKLYIRITNNSGADRVFVVNVRVTVLASA